MARSPHIDEALEELVDPFLVRFALFLDIGVFLHV